jgi:Tfp pilus assembly protein PilX
VTTLAKVVTAAFLVVCGLLGVATWQLVGRDRRIRALELAPQKAAAAAAQAKVETVTVQLQAAERVVTRTLTQVRTDTLMLRPVTAQDTLTALVQLPALAQAHDSLQHACSAFVVRCDEYRAAAEKRDTARLVVIAGLERQLHAAEPGRLEAIWGRVKLPLAFAGGLYVGLKVR